MTTFRQLSRPLRLAVAAPWLLLLAAVSLGSVPAFRQLVLNPATNQPATTVSLSGTNWTGTLDPARLPASVPQLDSDQNLIVRGFLSGQYGVAAPQYYGEGDPMIDLTDPATGYLLDDGGVSLSWTYGGVGVSGSLNVGGPLSAASFSGDGSLLSNVQALSLSDGASALIEPNGYEGWSVEGNLYTPELDTDFLDVAYRVISDGEYLYTANQAYQEGAISPTGYLILKDAYGTAYRIPAVAD